MTAPDMLLRAQQLVRYGFAVLPLWGFKSDGTCACGSPTCHSPGKHPHRLAPQGVLDATLNSARVAEWWVLGNHNIGIATGSISGVVALDIDPRHGGDISLYNIADDYGELPDTWRVLTGGGGDHFMFQYIEGMRNRTGIFPGVDFKTDGGYVVAPPSLHVSGERYRWLVPPHKTDRPEPAAMPHRWMDLLGVSASKQGAAQPLPETIQDGQRNNWLTSAGGAMRRKGFSLEAVQAALRIENARRCKPPLDQEEVDRIAWSINRYPAEYVPTVRAGGRVVSG